MRSSGTQGGTGTAAEKAEKMKIETIDIADLSHDPANLRKHSERNLDAIVASLRKFGQQHPIIINSQNIVMAGNGRLEAAKRLGWDKIQVVRSNLKGSDATAFSIADNRTAELAEWDQTALAETLRALQSEDFEIESAGFTDDEIGKLIESIGVFDVNESEAPALADGDRAPFQAMTFTLHDDQAEVIKRALDAAKNSGPFIDTGNENSNGNALARVAEAYIGQG